MPTHLILVVGSTIDLIPTVTRLPCVIIETHFHSSNCICLNEWIITWGVKYSVQHHLLTMLVLWLCNLDIVSVFSNAVWKHLPFSAKIDGQTSQHYVIQHYAVIQLLLFPSVVNAGLQNFLHRSFCVDWNEIRKSVYNMFFNSLGKILLLTLDFDHTQFTVHRTQQDKSH